MCVNSTKFIAKQLIKQVDEKSPESLMWIISSINRFLILNPNTTLLEFQRTIIDSAPETFNSYTEIMEEKNLKTIN